MQPQTTTAFREIRFNRLIVGAIVTIGIVAPSLFAIQTSREDQDTTLSQDLSPGIPAQADPPLPDGWVDPYFEQPAAILDEVDPPFSAETQRGGIDPRAAAEIRFLEQNLWDYAGYAQPAGDVEEPMSLHNYLFLEENIWGETSVPPRGEPGENY